MEQERLNPTLVYVLAIIGLFCCCILGSGFILAGAAFFIAHSQIKKASENPEAYELNSIKAMKTAKIISLVILIINILVVIRVLYVVFTVGWDELMIQFREIMEQAQQNQ